MSSHEISYQKHSDSYKDDSFLDELEQHRNWFDNYTANIWRHLRMLEVLNPFLERNQGAKWLTVGDGRFGTSAMYIEKKGGDAIASDIDDTLLKAAKENNLISEYKYVNAENIPFPDESFDYVFCKEAYHHFPRPYLAIYEMLRCAKEAIIFTEPRDWLPSPIPRRMLQMIKNGLKKVFGKKVPHPDEGSYEPAGNYVYTISEREFQKVALGMYLPMVAFKVFHDVYIDGVGSATVDPPSKLYRQTKNKIRKNSILSKLGLTKKNRVSAVIFKKLPSPEIESDLKERGFTVIKLPTNPYL